MSQHFLLITHNKDVAHWVQTTLQDEAEIVMADSDNLERVVQLIDAVHARVVLCELQGSRLSQDASFMEGLTAAKPLLPVIALAETADRQSVLTALRSGARDFISPDMRPGEVISLVRRAAQREVSDPQRGNGGSEGAMTAVASARPGGDTTMFALHLALALQEQAPKDEILLLDLGVPAGDSLQYLGIEPTYTFVDAIRSLRRLDETLINTAFPKHETGLRILAMPEDALEMSRITSADLYVLLSALKRHFRQIVVNLGGVPASEFLYVLLGRTDRTLLLVEQSVPSCKQNRNLLQKLRDAKVDKMGSGQISLVVDRYLPSVPPDAETIAKGFGIPLLSTLPSSGMARLTMMNSGESLFTSAPRDPYTVAIRKIAIGLGDDPRAPLKPIDVGSGWLNQLTNRFKTT
ncbi:AAA family ATPase [Aquabacterium sp. UBA2148]|jgi:pilus assembly protein CpaE|uniref:AAA family ATPase n=1 Tax=Aquabacterium sp. UBA2148 TaxID=1946042 RepID=UPI0025803BB2|nr:pilus assembly protein [Aquabacterium sp. UBA2148]